MPHDTAGTVASRNFLKHICTTNVPQRRAQGKQLFAQPIRNFVINVTNMWRISGRGMTDGGLMSGT